MKNQTPFENLKTGLLFLDFKQGTEEPEYEAMDRMTKKHGVIQKRYQYSQDLERAINEATLTITLLSNVESSVNLGSKTFDSEEIVSYYNGIFLDYVHQIKDKVLRLIWWLLQDENLKTIPDEPEHIRLRSFRQFESKLKEIDIFDQLEAWDQESSTGIAVALKKRLQHHHFVSNLQLNSDFQKIRMSKTMLSPSSVTRLTEYGKVRMKQIGEESYLKWKTEIVKKQQETLGLIVNNINEVSGKLIKHFKIPIEPEKQAEVINKYLEVQKRFDIDNKTDITKVTPEIKEVIDEFLKFNQEFLKEKLVSIYLVGSAPRGEFTPGSSDLNLIIIVDFDTFGLLPKKLNPIIDVHFFGEKEFLSEKNKKWRFICWSDGLSIYGKRYSFDKKEFPKPGTLLTLLLNRGVIEELEELKSQVTKLKDPSKRLLRYYSLKAVKTMLDFGFGVAMANKPKYTSSRKERIQYIKEMFPSAQRQTITFEAIYYKGIIRQQDFSMVIDTFLENAKKNYKKLADVEAEIIKGQEK
jgi:predicted nucleotidyltransferase